MPAVICAQEADLEEMMGRHEVYADNDSTSGDAKVRLEGETSANSEIYSQSDVVSNPPPVIMEVADSEERHSPVASDKSKEVSEDSQQLSFNFMYYLFYRFKLVDILDE